MGILFGIFFWTSNLVFLVIAYFGMLPFLGFSFVTDFLTGELPFDFFLPFVGLLIVPVVSIWAAVAFRSPQSPNQDSEENLGSNFSLPRFFYGVEAPLILLCLTRLFWLRELTPATGLMILTAVICVICFTYELVRIDRFLSPTAITIQMVTHGLMLLMGLYIGIICLFYVYPAAWIALISFSSLIVVFPIYFALVAILSMPFGMSIIYVQSWRQRLIAEHRSNRVWVTTGATMVVWVLLFNVLQAQPQVEAFSLLDRSVANDASRQELLQKSDKIREGLLNAYLWRYRYPSSVAGNDLIRSIYSNTFLPERTVDGLQQAYNYVTAPFSYNGSNRDSSEAELAYAKFFDRPILRAEQKAIQTAMKATSDRSEAKAGLLTINQQKVWLGKQEVSIEPHGDWADVEIHEVYTNRTYQQQEVFYYFSLPESAVVTGIWLGETSDRATSFPFTVSPRGAAQKVYNNEVSRRVDPALLEQVGPRNYRLRVFPIPQIPLAGNAVRSTPQNMHMWMTYKVMQQPDGWALPHLSERRNVFWDHDTQRIYNGQPNKLSIEQDDWFPSVIPAQSKVMAQAHQVRLISQTGVPELVMAKPVLDRDNRLPQGKKFALIIDTSRSMAAFSKELAQNFQWMQTQVAKDNDIDAYFTSSEGGTPKRLDRLDDLNLDRLVFYGLLRPQEMLKQFAQLQNGKTYDAVMVLTDAGSYELTDETKTTLSITAPLWMIHLGNFPAAYDDSTLAAIQDHGGSVATGIEDVMSRISSIDDRNPATIGMIDGYIWIKQQDNSTVSTEIDQGFQPLAARQLALSLGKKIDQNNPTQLDIIHSIAKQYNIVTPYSSMIVLVNDRQKQALKTAESQSDRFKRTVEDNQLPQPSTSSFNVSGVPEPAEWLLIGIVSIGLLLLVMLKRSQVSVETSIE